jgi:hypothetical protein
MKEWNKDFDSWKRKMRERLGIEAAPRFILALEASGVPDFKVSHDNGKGLWITIRKGEQP